MNADVEKHAFIGDVQGCADEFDELLDQLTNKLGADFKLHSVGDLVNRGPDNLRVLEQMRTRVEAGRAEYVLGNHEISLIAQYLEIRGPSSRDTLKDVLGSHEAQEWVEWLRRRPLCELGEINRQRYVVVHASVDPEWTFEDIADRAGHVEARLGNPEMDRCRELLIQNPIPGDVRDDFGRMVSCRSVQGGEWSSSGPEEWGGEAWHEAWRRRDHSYGVVYGHWAVQGLQVHPGSRGLDTGCVHNGPNRAGRLTAWLVGGDLTESRVRLFDLPDDDFISVKARHHYASASGSRGE